MPRKIKVSFKNLDYLRYLCTYLSVCLGIHYEYGILVLAVAAAAASDGVVARFLRSLPIVAEPAIPRVAAVADPDPVASRTQELDDGASTLSLLSLCTNCVCLTCAGAASGDAEATGGAAAGDVHVASRTRSAGAAIE